MASIPRGPLRDITVLVSGAGVGGLTAALECWRAGCNVLVLERAKGEVTTGDAFTIGPSALDIFRYWPHLDRRNQEIGLNPKLTYHRQTGERIAGPVDLEEVLGVGLSPEQKAKLVSRHSRPKFHAILLEQIAVLGIEVKYGMKVVDYYEDAARGRAGVVAEDGSKHEADLVIAADGLHGKSWSLIIGKPVPARPSGQAVFRCSYPMSLVASDPMIVERFPLDATGISNIELWSGPKMHAAFWRSSEEMHWSITHEDRGTAEESWNHRVSPDKAIDITSNVPGWPEVADRVIKATPAENLIDWKLMWRDPQPQWTSPGGLVLQLGDAAHTFLPSSGNGATQAMEDAISIAACLRKAGSKSGIPNATRVHNLLRFERVSCLQAFGVRNAEARDTSTKGQDTDKSMQVKFGKWLVSHDPEQYAFDNYEKALEHLEKGTEFRNTNIPAGMEYRPWTIEGLLDAQKRGEKTILDGDWS